MRRTGADEMRVGITLTSAIIGVSLLTLGCTKRKTVVFYDGLGPSAPRGVVSYTGDRYVLLSWLANPEPDVAGYDIYRGTDCGGEYIYFASTTDTFFMDDNVVNGNTYFYAIAAYDQDELQSDLSYECVFDTPRPEGVVVLYDYNQFPNEAGFDFSAQSRVRWDSPGSDIYFEYFLSNQTFYLNAGPNTDIQDFGYADNFSAVGWAPEQGWSDLGYAEVILGHVYIIRIWESNFIHYNYAKLRVDQISSNFARLEWAYQIDQDNPELKPVVQDSTKN